jgi:putative FmdB family regulatory protein
MPTYEYICAKCGHQFEKFQSISEDPLEVCPRELCARKRWGKGRVSRAISGGAGLLFKGSGFYITDYRSDNYRQAAKKESAPAAASEKSTASTAAPPAAASEKKAPKPAAT